MVLRVAVLGGFCAAANADDFAPPPWRGGPLSVYAEWDFDQAVAPPSVFSAGWNADVEMTVGGMNGETLKTFGDRTSHLDFDSYDHWTWSNQSSVTPAVTEGAYLAANVVNWIDGQPLKLLRIQVTYETLTLDVPDIVDEDVLGYEGDTLVPASLVKHVDVDSSQYYEDWRIVPNPDWEQIPIFVPYGTFVDQIVIDTISIPEPATWTLVTIGLAGWMMTRRK